jgi:hypothetical protein
MKGTLNGFGATNGFKNYEKPLKSKNLDGDIEGLLREFQEDTEFIMGDATTMNSRCQTGTGTEARSMMKLHSQVSASLASFKDMKSIEG